MQVSCIDSILDFWIGTASEDVIASKKRSKLWYQATGTIDASIKENYSDLLLQAEQRELGHWASCAKGSSALVILLDQFSRNIYRSTEKAFRNDEYALQITEASIDSEQHLELSLIERAFLYHPFKHSESLLAQDQSIELFHNLVRDAPKPWQHQMRSFARHAKDHRKIILQFGRFPHRNKILGRANTIEEQDYLNHNNNRFGQ